MIKDWSLAVRSSRSGGTARVDEERGVVGHADSMAARRFIVLDGTDRSARPVTKSLPKRMTALRPVGCFAKRREGLETRPPEGVGVKPEVPTNSPRWAGS